MPLYHQKYRLVSSRFPEVGSHKLSSFMRGVDLCHLQRTRSPHQEIRWVFQHELKRFGMWSALELKNSSVLEQRRQGHARTPMSGIELNQIMTREEGIHRR